MANAEGEEEEEGVATASEAEVLLLLTLVAGLVLVVASGVASGVLEVEGTDDELASVPSEPLVAATRKRPTSIEACRWWVRLPSPLND